MTKDIEQEWEHDYPIEDNETVIDKRVLLDENGNDINKKKSIDKTVEERIQTSRTLKIKHNKWNQVDYTEDYTEDKITIDPKACQFSSTFEDVEFEKKFHEIIKNSKYKPILLGEDKVTINYQIVNEMLMYIYARMKNDYSLCQIFVLICEYCGVGLPSTWKRLSSYFQMQILKELQEISKLPNELIFNDVDLFSSEDE